MGSEADDVVPGHSISLVIRIETNTNANDNVELALAA